MYHHRVKKNSGATEFMAMDPSRHIEGIERLFHELREESLLLGQNI
jgi:hypothetical protein